MIMGGTQRLPYGSVKARKTTPIPRKGRTKYGYGSAMPTSDMFLIGSHWYRVKVMSYGNSGAPYVTIRGIDYFL